MVAPALANAQASDRSAPDLPRPSRSFGRMEEGSPRVLDAGGPDEYTIFPHMASHRPKDPHAHALAALFQNMADMLAAHGANPYRVNAYRRAAISLVHLSENLTEVVRRGQLQSIPGIGRDLAGKIEEYLATGTIQSYEGLKRPLPPEIEAWKSLPGFSEGLVQYLYFRLRISSLGDLEHLVRSHLLRSWSTLTASEEELLQAIRERRRASAP